MPVTKADSSDAKKRHADATSDASQRRPSGTFDKNFARFSGVSGAPEKASNLFRVNMPQNDRIEGKTGLTVLFHPAVGISN